MHRLPILIVALLLLALRLRAAAATTRTRRLPATTATETTGAAADVDLDGVKSYLTDHTEQLASATTDFQALAAEYDALAKQVDYDYARLLAEQREEVDRILTDAKERWTEANPYYEQVEGVVAGTPSLAEYDVILDAGSSKAEDPESAVPFDLELSDGRTLEQPGNLFNLTEGMLWGTLPDLTAEAEADLNGDGQVEFGEALPDARVLTAAAAAFKQVRRRAPHRCRGVAADRVGRLHLARGDGADDERVLRPVEGIALRPGRRGRERGVQRRLPPLRHQRHHLGPAGRLRRHRAGRRRRRRSRRDADRERSSRSSARSSPTCRGRRPAASGSRPSRPTNSAPTRRSAPTRSRARSPSTQRSSGSRSSSSHAAERAHRSRARRAAGRGSCVGRRS